MCGCLVFAAKTPKSSGPATTMNYEYCLPALAVIRLDIPAMIKSRYEVVESSVTNPSSPWN